MTEHLIEAIDDLRRGLRLQFTRVADRLGHTICWIDGDHVVPLLRSREGTDQQSFPPSPPMQQIAILYSVRWQIAYPYVPDPSEFTPSLEGPLQARHVIQFPFIVSRSTGSVNRRNVQVIDIRFLERSCVCMGDDVLAGNRDRMFEQHPLAG